MSDIKLTSEELEAMLDRAARRGAKEALRSIGLLDDDAHRDITELDYSNPYCNCSRTNIHRWRSMDVNE
jgi:hypothetical protein